jgi:hypothetical protein
LQQGVSPWLVLFLVLLTKRTGIFVAVGAFVWAILLFCYFVYAIKEDGFVAVAVFGCVRTCRAATLFLVSSLPTEKRGRLHSCWCLLVIQNHGSLNVSAALTRAEF